MSIFEDPPVIVPNPACGLRGAFEQAQRYAEDSEWAMVYLDLSGSGIPDLYVSPELTFEGWIEDPQYRLDQSERQLIDLKEIFGDEHVMQALWSAMHGEKECTLDVEQAPPGSTTDADARQINPQLY